MLAAFALRNWREIAFGFCVLVLLACAALGFWRGMETIKSMVADAARVARDERDSHWKAEIEKANAATERAISDQSARFNALEAARLDAENRASVLDSQLEEKSRALDAATVCGLDVGRWRLLDGPGP